MEDQPCNFLSLLPSYFHIYPKGNGTAEAMVKVAKALMHKSKDVYAALLSC